MPALSQQIATEFCRLCSWAHEVWTLHRALFDDNPDIAKFRGGPHEYFLHRLSTITQEYALHQMIKLHDPAVQGRSINLGIAYVIEFGGWDEATAAHLQALRARLDTLAERIRPARNKAVAHNDLAALLAAKPLGEFPADADKEYFTALQEFVNLVHDKAVGGPYPFADYARTDVHVLLKALATNMATGA